MLPEFFINRQAGADVARGETMSLFQFGFNQKERKENEYHNSCMQATHTSFMQF
jgi:hypothetical protein